MILPDWKMCPCLYFFFILTFANCWKVQNFFFYSKKMSLLVNFSKRIFQDSKILLASSARFCQTTASTTPPTSGRTSPVFKVVPAAMVWWFFRYCLFTRFNWRPKSKISRCFTVLYKIQLKKETMPAPKTFEVVLWFSMAKFNSFA